MASTDRREVELALRVTTANADAVRDLQADLKALGKEGGAAAPEVEQLAGELTRLLDEAKQLDALAASTEAVGGLAEKHQQAAAKAAELTAQFTALQAATKNATQAQQEAKAQWQSAKDAVQAQNDAIRVLRASVKDGTLTEYQYGLQLKQSLQALADAKARVRDLRDAHDAAKLAVATARAEQNALSNEYRNTATASGALGRKLQELEGSAADAARSLGLSSSSAEQLAGAQVRVGQSLADVKQRMGAYADEIERARHAAASQQQASEAAAVAEKANAAGYATWWRNALQAREQASAKLEQAIRAEAQAARQSAAAVQDAFHTVGAKSVSALEAHIDATVRAMRTLRDSGELTGAELRVAMRQGAAAIADLERQIRAARGELTLMDKASGLWQQSLGGVRTSTAVAIAGVALLADKARDLGRAFVGALVQGDQMRRGLNAVYKDADLAASQMSFLRKTASESGVALGAVSSEFVRFSASMRSANIPLDQSNALFAAVTRAASSLGLGAEETRGTLNALAQMASKGTVSMEELRQQLGDRLPGALGLAAKGLGITEAQLISLVENGNLAARDLFPALTKALSDLGAETDGLLPTWERFKGLLTQTAQAMGDAGATTLLTGAMKALGAVVGAVAVAISGFVESVFLAGSAVVAFYGHLRGDADALAFFQQQAEQSGARLRAMRDALANLVAPADAAQQGTSALGAAAHITAEQLDAARDAAAKYAGAQIQSAQAAKLLADAHSGAAGGIVQFNTRVTEMLAQQALAVQVAQNDLKATKERGDALVALAKIAGDVTREKEAEAQASAALAQASTTLTAAKRAEVELLAVHRQVLLEDAQARKLNTEETKAATAAVDAKLAKAASELGQLQESTKALENEALARKLASDAMRDNSQRLAEYEGAAAAARAEVERLQTLQKQGVNVSGEMAEATSGLAQAEHMRADALKDQLVNLDAKTRLERAQLDLQVAQVSNSARRYDSLAAEARMLGDVATALYYEIRAKEEGLRITQLKLKIAELEQQAQLAEIQLKRQGIDAATDEGKAKLKLLDIEVQVVKVKQTLNQEIRDQIEAQQREIDAMRQGIDVRGSSTSGIVSDTKARNANREAIDATTSALERQIAAQEKANQLAERAAELERKRRGVDKEGFTTDKNGNRLVAGSDLGSLTGIAAFLKSAGVADDAVARKIAREFADENGNVTYANNPGQRRYGGDTLSVALLKAAESYTFGIGSNSANTKQMGTGEKTPAIPDLPAKTYNVTLGNKTVRTVSDTDAQTLMELLAQAQRAA